MSKVRSQIRQDTSRRGRAIRTDASIDTAQREIAEHFNLPPESVRLVNPSGRKARSDKTIGQFCRDWGW